MANNFDAMRMAVQAVFPTNDVLMDDKDEPSIMVYIPAFRLCDVLSTSDTSVHPAFRMNGTISTISESFSYCSFG